MHPGTRFIKCVDRLIGKVPVGDVSCGELNAGFNGIIRVNDIVMLFIPLLDVMEDMYRLFHRSRLDQNFLEPAFESAILLNVLAVLIERGCPDALYLAPGQSRLKHVGGIE